MSVKRRRWPWLVGGVLTLAALAVALVALDRFTREPPNYAEVEPGLFVGGDVADPPPGASAVLNLCESEDRYRAAFHEWHPIRDASPAPSLEWLRDRVAFVETHRAAGRVVYVHCRNGVSRSVTVVTAYLMKSRGLSFPNALAEVKAKRDLARPNPAFRELLVAWETPLAARPVIFPPVVRPLR